jgi:hypothetical protein
MEKHERSFTVMNKKKIICIGAVLAIALSTSAWVYFAQDDTEPRIVSPIEDGLSAEKKNEKETVKKSAYEDLNGLDYTLLRADKVGEFEEHPAFFMDILVDVALSEEDLSSLGKAVEQETTNVEKEEDVVASIHLKVFTSKASYEYTQTEDYDGSHIEGLVQDLTLIIGEEKKMVSTNYQSFSPTVDVEAMSASDDFEVKEASLSEDGQIISSDVVLNVGTKEQTQDTIASLVAMMKGENKGVGYVNLRIFGSEEAYKKMEILYEYSTFKPNLIIQQLESTY